MTLGVMGWIFTAAAAVVAAADLQAALFRYPELFATLLAHLRTRGAEGLSSFMGCASVFTWALMAWSLCLVVLLRDRHEAFALAWAVTLVLAACETVYTERSIRARLADPARAEPLRLQVSWPFRAWRVFVNVMTLVGCALMVVPQG